jgi:hypothetical protein
MTRSTDPQSGRELPKAYLRLDPDVDQKHPDNLAEFIRLMCASARQRPRGRFANKAVLEALFGRAAVGRFVARGDVEAQPDGSVITAGWSDWQEGDMTVAERVRRTRHKKAEALLDRYTDVTQPFPDPLPIPLPPSTVLTSPVATVGSETVGETVPSGDPPLMEVIHTIERISRRPWSYRPGSWAWDTLEPDVRDFGPTEVIRALEAVKNIKHPDGGQLVSAMHIALHPFSNGKVPKRSLVADPSQYDTGMETT